MHRFFYLCFIIYIFLWTRAFLQNFVEQKFRWFGIRSSLTEALFNKFLGLQNFCHFLDLLGHSTIGKMSNESFSHLFDVEHCCIQVLLIFILYEVVLRQTAENSLII
jgi:hypothetical protein